MAELDERRAALEAELELLRAMYGEELSEREDDGAMCIALRPNSGGESLQRFVEATLVLQARVELGYPETPATVQLERVRGLVDDEETELRTGLLERARDCASRAEDSLFSLVEAAVEQLTVINTSGACPICRDPLFDPPPDEPDAMPGACLLSTCYHSFHTQCLGAWWHTCTEQRAAAAAAPPAEQQSRAAAAEAAAKAAEAAAVELRAKQDSCTSALEALEARLAMLRAQVDPPPPPQAERKAVEERRELATELQRLQARVAKAEQRAAALAHDASSARAAEANDLSEAPLPCPVCRAELSVQSLQEAGVVRAPALPSEAIPISSNPTVAALAELQRERQRQLIQQQQPSPTPPTPQSLPSPSSSLAEQQAAKPPPSRQPGPKQQLPKQPPSREQPSKEQPPKQQQQRQSKPPKQPMQQQQQQQQMGEQRQQPTSSQASRQPSASTGEARSTKPEAAPAGSDHQPRSEAPAGLPPGLGQARAAGTGTGSSACDPATTIEVRGGVLPPPAFPSEATAHRSDGAPGRSARRGRGNRGKGDGGSHGKGWRGGRGGGGRGPGHNGSASESAGRTADIS